MNSCRRPPNFIHVWISYCTWPRIFKFNLLQSACLRGIIFLQPLLIHSLSCIEDLMFLLVSKFWANCINIKSLIMTLFISMNRGIKRGSRVPTPPRFEGKIWLSKYGNTEDWPERASLKQSVLPPPYENFCNACTSENRQNCCDDYRIFGNKSGLKGFLRCLNVWKELYFGCVCYW